MKNKVEKEKEVKLYILLSDFAFEVNNGWKPKDDDVDEIKWAIYYSSIERKYKPLGQIIAKTPGVYFKTKDLALRAINEIVIPFKEGRL